ncbi:hypothetical protein J6590_027020 [Homalodisca vitripennis]|nr:hypothetical protein J6590_027020 [Homalodisca vitripennis]
MAAKNGRNKDFTPILELRGGSAGPKGLSPNHIVFVISVGYQWPKTIPLLVAKQKGLLLMREMVLLVRLFY